MTGSQYEVLNGVGVFSCHRCGGNGQVLPEQGTTLARVVVGSVLLGPAGSGCDWVGSIGAALIHQATECNNQQSSPRHRNNNNSNNHEEVEEKSWEDKAVREILKSRVFAIDVGDRTFRASERTLRRESGSVLDRLFSGDHDLPRGSYHQIGKRRVGKECLRLCRSRWSPYH